MKKLVLILCLTAIIACKTDKKEVSTETVEEVVAYQVLKGSYLYYADAAILQTPTEVYGVVLDDNSVDLDKKVKPYKVLDTDMVPVEIKGEIIPKLEGEEGWPLKVKIVEILKVTKPAPEKNDVITLGKE
jgi:hypothetical protein